MSFLAPALLVGLSALALPVLIHLVQRERRQVLPFPSLMFVRRIPYQSVRRRRIRDWLLLAMRVAALLMIVLAFARPFFDRGAIASASASGGREVVILLDRSASMAYGGHWARARAAARSAVARLGSGDRATLVLFAATAEESVRATGDRARLDEAIDATKPGSGATRYGPALKLAMSILAKSSLPRREAVLISDFQKSGWRGGEDVHFPEGTIVTPMPITSSDTRNLSVPSVSLTRATFSGKERVTLTAAIRNSGSAPAANVPVSLTVGDSTLETLPATVGPNAATTVTFAPFTLATPGLTATVRAGSDSMPDDNVFRLVLAPASTVTALLIEPDRVPSAGLYLRNAFSIGASPGFQLDTVAPSGVTPPVLARTAVVVLDGVAPSRVSADLVRFVERGGGLLMLLGGDAAGGFGPAAADAALPGPASADTPDARVTTIGFVDYSHPVFELFQGPHGGDFSSARVYRYRPLAPRPNDRVLARFSDGAVALLERRIGSGRVIAWTSTLDDSWTDLALKPVFLPFVQQTALYLAQYHEPKAWQTVGQALDLDDAGGRPVAPGTRDAAPLVLAPSGRRLEANRFVELDEQGFYEVRRSGTAPVNVAVNIEPAESDLTPLDPQELVASITGHAGAAGAAQGAPLTPEELEARQSLWRTLLLAGLLLLAAETAMANRLSVSRAGAPARVAPHRPGRADVAVGRIAVEGGADVAR